ncbi:MAG TPA: radical SAM protein [Xanthobacteraceae bacterium]|jgi:MoaA/NifB/PqqE/SkfB family radical SAM enzyme|nr:radical SAM protein [Xanthobacteraceae bacterium]
MAEPTTAHAPPRSRAWDTQRLVLSSGGPGRCEFTLNNACNANCGFCNFARDALPKERWDYVERQGAFDAIDILFRQGIRYLVLTSGEPTLHPDLIDIIARACGKGMKVMLVSNGGLFKARRIGEYADAGLSSFVISIDAATAQAHEDNRGLPGVCDKIRAANREITRRGLISTASVTLSRLLDIDALPAFLDDLGFKAVTFSYPLTNLNSSFLGYRDSGVVDFTEAELIALFDKVKALKSRIHVVNPTRSLEEMQRFVRNEPQNFPCLGGFRCFYLDWKLQLRRCHFWERPLCSIYDFDDAKLVRDDCTLHDRLLPRRQHDAAHRRVGSRRGAIAARGRLRRRRQRAPAQRQAGSIHAVAEGLPWLMRF